VLENLSTSNRIALLGCMVCLLTFFSCGKQREDIVLEAFTEPMMDYYSLKLYANGEFDFHIPVIDYYGRYLTSGDTITLRSIEREPRKMSVTVNGRVMTKTITEMEWRFLIDEEKRQIRSISSPDTKGIWIDIVMNKLQR
jgi:hypothetical protein